MCHLILYGVILLIFTADLGYPSQNQYVLQASKKIGRRRAFYLDTIH